MAAPTRFTILWENLVPNLNAYSCDDEDTDYPASNLYGNDIHTIARTNDDSGTKVWYIDMGTSAEYDTLVVAGHNLPSGSTVRVSTNTVTPFVPNQVLTGSNIGVNCYKYYWTTTQTNRYVGFSTYGTTTNGVHQIGLVWVGKRLQLARNPQIPIGLIRNKDTTKLVTGGGQVWSYENFYQVGYKLKFIENFESDGAGMYASLEELYLDRGEGKPFMIDIKPYDTNTPPVFVHTTSFDFSIDGKDARVGNWEVEEEK
jgi:hypothetical protein